jgi:zinc transport system substrate-binding protein
MLCIAAVFMVLVPSCRTQKPQDNRIGVVVTILPVADFVEHIGADRVAVTVMIPPGASPHTYEPPPSRMVEVSRATVYFKVGSGVEFELEWMDKILKQNPGLRVVDCSTGITIEDGDPHIWNSPLNAAKMAETIGQGLASIDADNAKEYMDNTQRYINDLMALDDRIHRKVDGFTNRAFMIYHPSFAYLASAYGMDQIAIEHGGKEPTLKVIQDSIDLAKKYDLQYVFAAPQFSTAPAETIAKAIGGQVVLIDPLPEHYIDNVDKVIDSLVAEFEN